jgi:hypothetical protein
MEKDFAHAAGWAIVRSSNRALRRESPFRLALRSGRSEGDNHIAQARQTINLKFSPVVASHEAQTTAAAVKPKWLYIKDLRRFILSDAADPLTSLVALLSLRMP